jgi:cell division protein FtsQ
MSPTSTKARPKPGTPARKRSAMDPRISARRTAVTRQKGRRRFIVLIAVASVATLAVAGWLLVHTGLFSARVVTVVGDSHETTAQVVAAAGLTTHPPLIDVNAGAVERAVTRLPWVRTASVSVHWPDGVHIAVHEEVPRLVMAAGAGRWAVLSADGRVLSVAAAAAQPAGLILVTGPQLPGAPGTSLGPADQVGLTVASTLPPSFRAQVTAVGVEPGGWVQLKMTTPILVDIGTATQLPAKYEDVTSILSGAALHVGDVIDVSVPGAPTVTGG